MKKLIFYGKLWTIALLMPVLIYGQAKFECYTESPPGESFSTTSSLTVPCTNLNYSEEDYKLLNEFTIYVNFHFIENANGENFHMDPNGDPLLHAPTIVNRLLDFSNGYWADPILNQLSTNPTKVFDSRIRLELYSEAGNPDDPNGGIFFHPFTAAPADLGANSAIGPTNTAYGDQVLHITLRDRNNALNTNNPNNVSLSGQAFGWGLRIDNLFWHHSRGIERPWDYARNINHEVGHIYNLPHSFSCDNLCTDMDNTVECGGPSGCTQFRGVPCTNNPGPCNPTWGGLLNCCHCTWGMGNNFMGYNGDQRAMTVCQWEIMMQRMLQQSRAYASFCVKEESTLVLPEGENITWDNIKVLNRDVVVPKGTTLTITCEVRMGEQKKFIVQRGGKLIVDGGKITNLCPDTRWQGIYVHGNGNREQPEPFGTQTSDDAGILIVQNGSVIERAANAITTKGEGAYGGYDYFGGVVYAEGSEFINNGRVAEFMKYDFPNKSQFIDCTINKTSDWTINAIGITIWDCEDIIFSGNTFSNLDGTGISGINYGADVINANQFLNCNRGIEVLSTSSGISRLTLTGGNNFQNNVAHVVTNAANAQTGMIISGNTFGPASFGIWVEGESRYAINSNTFTDSYFGIATIDAGIPTNFIANNSFTNSHHGITASGNNRRTSFTNNCFDQTVFGDVVLELPLTGGTTEVRELQSQGGDPAANCFNETTASIDISAQPMWSTQFKYVVTNSSNANLCYLPANNLSDGGVNNYELIFVNEEPTSCTGLLPNPTPDPPTEGKLNQKQQLLQQAWQQWQSDLNSINKQLSYYQALENFEELRGRLLALWQQDGEYTKIDNLLALDATQAGKQNRIGFQFSRNNLAQVANLLANYPITTADDQRYVDVQNIYLQYLQTPTTFSLNSTQDQFLRTVAIDQSLPYRGQAAALLAHLTGENFVIGLPNSSPPPALRSLPSSEEPSANYRIYPNPSNGELTIELPESKWDSPYPLTCRIYNAQGQEVFRQVLANASKTILGLPDQLTGVYWLEITDQEKRLHQERIVLIK